MAGIGATSDSSLMLAGQMRKTQAPISLNVKFQIIVKEDAREKYGISKCSLSQPYSLYATQIALDDI